MNIFEFEKFLSRKKVFRDLDDIYKTPKFLQLFLKMYEYILSIPKDKIVHVKIQKYYTGITYYFLDYILLFLKAKDFYHWRERLYKLMTEKIGSKNFKKFELLYGQKAKEFFNEGLEKRRNTCLRKYGVDNYSKTKEYKEKYTKTCINHYGCENPMQSEEIKEKSRKTNLKRRGCEYSLQSKEVREKIIQTNLERYGTEYPMQSEKVKEKFTNTCIEKYGCENPFQNKEVREKFTNTCMKKYRCAHPSQNKEVREKINNTKLKKYGNIFGNVVQNNHSKIADEFCANLYTKLPDDIKPYCIFFKKSNKEYMLEMTGKKYFYDFTISSESIKVIIEFDGLYWHGLKKDQKFVKCHNKEVPVEEIWEMDEEKQKLAEDNGFRVIRVREDEYLKNKEKTLKRVLKCIKG